MLLLLGLVIAPTAADADDATPWAGWVAHGPAAFVRSSPPTITGAVASSGATVLVTESTGFTVSDGVRRTTGIVPLAAAPNADRQPPLVLPSGRLVVAGGCDVSTSDDLGRTWSANTLPACEPSAPAGPVFVDARRGVVVLDTPKLDENEPLPAPNSRTGPAVIATDDGGRTWAVRRPAEPGRPSGQATSRTSEPGPADPRPRVTVTSLTATPSGTLLRVSSETVGATAFSSRTAVLERSDDLGATWQRVALPGVPTPESVVAPDARYGESAKIGRPAATPAGMVVVPVDDALLVSTDDLRTFTRVAAPGREPRVLCDPAGSCLVDVADPSRSGRRTALPFDGTGFGLEQAPLPDRATAPAPGEVLGIGQIDSSIAQTLRSTDGGRSYAPTSDTHVARWLDTDRGVLTVRQVDAELQISTNGTTWRTIPAPPAPTVLVRAASATSAGGLVALSDDGQVWSWASGRWSSWDASSIDPTTLAVSDSAVLVVGNRGILRGTSAGSRRTLRVDDQAVRGAAGPPMRTIEGLGAIATRGRLALAWTGDDERSGANPRTVGGLLRSTDGGRTWRHLTNTRYTDDLQIVSARTVYRTYRSGLYRSQDGGRRFVLRNRVDADPDLRPATIAFRDRRTGIVGTSITTDGGRTLTDLPVSGAGIQRPAADGVLTTGPLGTALLNADLLRTARRPRISLRATHWTRDQGSSSGTVTGRVHGVPAGTRVEAVVTPRRLGIRHVPLLEEILRTDAAGAFHGRLSIEHRLGNLLRLQVRGQIGASASTLGARSRWIRVPR